MAFLGPLPGGVASALRHAVAPERGIAADSLGEPLRYAKRALAPPHGSPLKPGAPSAPRPIAKPAALAYADWVSDTLLRNGGVVASVPADGARLARSVALDTRAATGNAAYWTTHLLENEALFAESRGGAEDGATHASAVTLEDGAPAFFPEGGAYGVGRAGMDALIDAGFTVEVNEAPYSQRGGVAFERRDQREAACAKEISMRLLMAEAGVAPCVLAAFYARREDEATGARRAQRGEMGAMVVVSQVHTFCLGDLMHAARAGEDAKRAASVLRSAVPLVMKQLRALSEVRGGCGVVKADLTAESVVFCADLRPSGDDWTLGGVGHRPVSREHVDGVPKICGYRTVLSRRMRAARHDVDAATVLHALLLLGFSEAVHGAGAAAVLREHFMQEGSEYQEAAAAAAKKRGGTAAFLAEVANNADVASLPELHDAMLEVAEQAGAAAREGGRLPPRETLFPRLVSFVTRTTGGGAASERDDAADAEAMRALEGVKHTRALSRDAE